MSAHKLGKHAAAVEALLEWYSGAPNADIENAARGRSRDERDAARKAREGVVSAAPLQSALDKAPLIARQRRTESGLHLEPRIAVRELSALSTTTVALAARHKFTDEGFAAATRFYREIGFVPLEGQEA